MKNLIFLLCTLFTSFTISAQSYSTPSEIPNPKDLGDGFVSDPEDYIYDEDEEKINQIITEVRDIKGFEIAVVVVASINNKGTLPFATDLGNLWGVGKGDRGIVILVAVQDREMAIATGYETEQYIPDLITAKVREEEFNPFFRMEDYSGGMLNGVSVLRDIIMDENVPYYIEELKEAHANNVLWEQIASIVALILIALTIIISPKWKTVITTGIVLVASLVVAIVAYFVALRHNYPSDVILDVFMILGFIAIAVKSMIILRSETKKVWPYAIYMGLVVPVPLVGLYLHGFQSIVIVYLTGAAIIFGLFLLFYTFSLLTKDPYKKYHLMKFFKLDVFGYIFPMPMYVADLFVENQLENWRNRVRYSPKTGLEMRKLSEQADNKYLESGQVKEEQVKSVDYDVWITDEPDDVLILRYSTWFTKYNTCSKCKYKTWYLVYDKTISSPTYSSSGTGEKKKACAHCSHQVITRYTIPRKTPPGSSSSSSSGGWSSSSSSSGGSWGGGSFGGGGSSGSW